MYNICEMCVYVCTLIAYKKEVDFFAFKTLKYILLALF